MLIWINAKDFYLTLNRFMENFDPLLRHGLFDAKVPRYTSYPPANHFQSDVGMRNQAMWLEQVDPSEDISVYVHIPFCKRLCWFCACRTQGTRTMRPVRAYVAVLKKEIEAVRRALPDGVRMGRLHLGGGTPTILPPETMAELLDALFAAFPLGEGFEFSVEIDPTEASEALLETLVRYGMNRASIGVQDFAPHVQAAIGRPQTLEQTRGVLTFLRDAGLRAVNLDLLYGLPHQTTDSFRQTLSHVMEMDPDRLAIYGYAHVPWMSKRQVLIKAETLPDTHARFELATIAHDTLVAARYEAIGIDHFAKPTDSLSKVHAAGRLRRNFQGYTDDQSRTLVGLGASAISRFAQGYQQNAVATSAYQDRISASGLAGHKGYVMSEIDNLLAQIIEDLMCRFVMDARKLQEAYPLYTDLIRQTKVALMAKFDDVFHLTSAGLEMRPEAYPLVRIIAHFVDRFATHETAHAAAI